MPTPPDPVQDHPDPLAAEIVPTEAIRHPAYGQVSAWITDAMSRPPSPGSLGRMELLRHLDRIPTDKRCMLLLTAREMSRTETQ